MTETLYSVVAELEDGTKKVIPVRGHSSSEAFRQVQATAGVRRVGRVMQGTSVAQPSAERERPSQSPRVDRVPQHGREADDRLEHVISGPRIVVYAPPASGERPFKYLKAPPERPKTAPAKQTSKAQPSAGATRIAATPEHRIVKSRRRDGLPYLVQRGVWQELNGKRTFKVDSESGFENRELAEQHIASEQTSGAAPADLQRSA